MDDMREEQTGLSCLDCFTTACRANGKEFPEFCLTKSLDTGLIEEAEKEYRADPLTERLAQASCEVEGEFYGQMTRVEETMEFARRIGARKIGIATCVGLMNESHILAKILRVNGFEVYGVCCKVGSLLKLDTGLSPEQLAKFKNGPIMCNPIGQALLLNRARTQLNILMGLCVGHDTLFYKFCEGYCTTLVTKDRVLAHNPAGALYQTGSFYRKLMSDGRAGG